MKSHINSCNELFVTIESDCNELFVTIESDLLQ